VPTMVLILFVTAREYTGSHRGCQAPGAEPRGFRDEPRL